MTMINGPAYPLSTFDLYQKPIGHIEDVSNLYDLKLDQDHHDLIFNISNCPSYLPIPYVKDGLYDRIFLNIKEHSSELEFLNNEEYDWNMIPIDQKSSFYKDILLGRPDKNLKRKIIAYKRNEMTFRYYKWLNVVKLTMFLYRSSNFPKIIAYTYGNINGNNLIKPLKILTHDWERLYGLKYQAYGKKTWVCRKCEMLGYGSSKAILPKQLLSCDDMMIKDIIL